MLIPEEQMSQEERTASAKVLRWQHAGNVQEEQGVGAGQCD